MKQYQAIVLVIQDGKKIFIKYRKISNINRFVKFAENLPGYQYFNLYDRLTRNFVKRYYKAQ